MVVGAYVRQAFAHVVGTRPSRSVVDGRFHTTGGSGEWYCFVIDPPRHLLARSFVRDSDSASPMSYFREFLSLISRWLTRDLSAEFVCGGETVAMPE